MEGRSAQLSGCQQMAKEARPELSEEALGCLLTEKSLNAICAGNDI